MGSQDYYSQLLKKFDRLTKKQYAALTLQGIQIVLIGALSLFLVLSVAENFGHFSSLIRTILFFIFLVAVPGLSGWLVIRPLLRYLNLLGKTDYFSLARTVGRYFPFLKDDLLNAMQLITIDRDRQYHSSSLTEAAFRQVWQKTEPVDFSLAASYSPAKGMLKYLLGASVIFALLFGFSGNLRASAGRLMRFDQEFIPPAKFSFQITPGNKQITKGEDVFIRARIIGPIPKEVFIGIKTAEQTDFEYKTLTADSSGLYVFEASAVRSSFDYFIKAEDVSSGSFRIEVIDRPVIRTLDVRVTPPSYSGLQAFEQKDNGNVTSLPGSSISFSLTSTRSLKSAVLSFNDSTTFRLGVSGNTAQGSYRIKGDIDYRIILTSTDGHQNENPVTYSIKTLVDAPPAIEMVLPAKDITLSEDNRAAFMVKVSDDYGFSSLKLNYSVRTAAEGSKEERSGQIDVPFNRAIKENDVNYIWNLTDLNLSPKDMVSYYFEIFDNDYVSGPKSARTAAFSIRVPSLEELLSQADETHNSAEDRIAETLKEAADLKQTLQELQQDLKQDKRDISWQEKERVEKAVEKFSQLQEKMSQVRKDLSEMQNELRENNLLSRETLEKYMELQELFRDLSSEEMKKALEKMQQSLQQMNRDKVEQSMQEMNFNEEQFKNSVERTLKLLKRIQVEQKMDELTKRADMLEKALEEQKQDINNANLNNPQQNRQLQQQQREITEQMQKMDQSMQELQNKMSDFKDMPQKQMEQMKNDFSQQQNQQLSEQAEQQIEMQQKQQASQSESRMQQNMQKMKSSISGMQKQMQKQGQKQAFNEMRRVLDNLLSLSKQQESIRNQTQNLTPNSSEFTDRAREQNNLQGSMEKLFSNLNQLAQKSFAVTPEMARALGQARNNMRESVQSLQERNSPGASQRQAKAMGALNEAATMMKASMESMMNGGGNGGGMMSLMQQLEQMSKQQMGINNMTQQMQQQGGQLSQQQLSQMQRLAQQQDMIRKSIEQLNRESQMSGQSKKIPANLEQIAKEMQEIVSQMRTERPDNDLVQKQEKILSRMLDAQRSINDRDYEQQREARAGTKTAQGRPPAELNLQSPQGKDRIKDELSRAVQEGYSKDYENLIRRYYELIENKK